MSDTTTPPPAPTPSDDHQPKPRGYFNRAQLDDLTLAEDVLSAAQDPAHADLLTTNRLSADWLGKFATLLAGARKKISATGQAQDTADAAVVLSVGTERALVIALQGIQAARKQQKRMAEIDETAPEISLDGYFIGLRLNPNRAGLLQNADALIAKAKLDNLPGYDTPAIAGVETALADYRDDKTAQHGAEEDQTTDRTDRDALMDKINAGRMAIQHAADPLWPYTEKANRPLRKAFSLPLTRPFNG